MFGKPRCVFCGQEMPYNKKLESFDAWFAPIEAYIERQITETSVIDKKENER